MALTKAPKEMLDVDLATTAYVDAAVAAGGGAVSVGPANPESISVKTTSYTIPAGKSARVRFTRADATLNGTAVFYNTTASISIPSDNQTQLTTGSYVYPLGTIDGPFFISGTIASSNKVLYFTSDVPTAYYVWILGSQPTPSFYSSATNASGTTSFSFNANSGGSAPINLWVRETSSSTNVSAATITITNFRTLKDNLFWVPAGTVLGGTGAIVEEYVNA